MVAIKVLPSAALASEDDRARFYREAKAAAQLHHPHIASVFEIDEAVPSDAPHGTEPSPFIAMEFIEGDTLHDRIQTGPLKLEQAVRIAREIASALEVAHSKGVVHRDIKAANIMLTAKGSAKVLDFGLAQTAQSTKLTQMGSTLGTVAYMSPEQARGEEVDLKTDLWSLGAVLYEMIAGRSPFPGDYEQAVVYEILNQDPEPLTAVRTGVPIDLEAVVNKCLAKDPDLRYPSAEALIVDLKRIEASSAVRTTSVSTQTSTIAATVPVPAPSAKLPWMPLAAAGFVILVVGLFLGSVLFENEPVVGPASKTHLVLRGAVSPLQAAITPDDRALFYVSRDSVDGRRQLSKYDFESGVQSILAQTDKAAYPISSPDGRWIAFMTTDTRQWLRISVSGGDPIEIPGAISPGRRGATYAPNGDFIYPDTSWSIMAVDRTGSTRLMASSGSGDERLFFDRPVASPSNNFITWSDFPQASPATSWIFREGSSEREKLMDGSWIHTITTSGHALFIRGNVFQPQQTVAVPIDLYSGALLGEEVPIGVWSAAVSPSGLLVYEDLSNQIQVQPSKLYRVMSSGAAEFMFTLPGIASRNIAVSGDGSMLAVSARGEANTRPDMYLVNVNSGIGTRLTRGGWYDIPTWGPNDEFLYFDFVIPGSSDWSIMRRRADGSGTNEPILVSLDGGDPVLTSDGRFLIHTNGGDIWGHDLIADTSFVIIDNDILKSKPAISPDGRFVAYAQGGNPCGSIQVSAVQTASEPIEIAANGCFPLWTPDGEFIYYQNTRNVSRVSVTTDPVFEISGTPSVVYTTNINRSLGADGGLFFDVAGDGTLYVAHAEASTAESPLLWVVHNWFEELNRLAPRSN